MSIVNGLDNSVLNLKSNISDLNSSIISTIEWNDNVASSCRSYANSLVKVGDSFTQMVQNLRSLESDLYKINNSQDEKNVEKLISEVEHI